MPLSEMREAAGDPVSVVVILLSLDEDGLIQTKMASGEVDRSNIDAMSAKVFA